MKWVGRFFLLVLILSFGELYLLIAVADRTSILFTLFACVFTGILGGALVRYQGLQTLAEIQGTMKAGNMPARPIISGLILLVIGTMLLTPGFITDTLAFMMLIPALRNLTAAYLIRFFKDRIRVVGPNVAYQSGRKQKPEDIIIEVDAEEVSEDSPSSQERNTSSLHAPR